jgi:GNAT superfamily N-acetyltransferase
MPYALVPFSQDYLEPAVALFIDTYKGEQAHSPLLPSRVIDEPAWIRGVLQSKLANPGVAVVEQNRLLGYMLTGDQFQWKGQQAAIILEYCHGAVVAQRRALYQRMYMALAQEWVNQHIHLHLIRHFAHDTILQETLYQLGFGAILAERLRDVSPVTERHDLAIRVEQDVIKLIALQTEHNRYYPQAPIFILKPTDTQDVLVELEAHTQQGDVFLVYDEQAEPCAYMIVGESTNGGEGSLLAQTNTAQIKSAYARPEVRGKGVGAALLQRVIEWSQQQSYERLFVEHETANIYGGNFWGTYFSPYLYASMRYVDTTLPIPAREEP